MFEHMAFKAESIGTKNWPAEKKALQDVEDVTTGWKPNAQRPKATKARSVTSACSSTGD